MCEILSEVTEDVVLVTRRVTGFRCDICGKNIPLDKRNESIYFKVTTGDDDCELRIEYYQDICPDCVNKFIADYLGNANGTSRYIGIETRYATAYKRYDDGKDHVKRRIINIREKED